MFSLGAPEYILIATMCSEVFSTSFCGKPRTSVPKTGRKIVENLNPPPFPFLSVRRSLRAPSFRPPQSAPPAVFPPPSPVFPPLSFLFLSIAVRFSFLLSSVSPSCGHVFLPLSLLPARLFVLFIPPALASFRILCSSLPSLFSFGRHSFSPPTPTRYKTSLSQPLAPSEPSPDENPFLFQIPPQC